MTEMPHEVKRTTTIRLTLEQMNKLEEWCKKQKRQFGNGVSILIAEKMDAIEMIK